MRFCLIGYPLRHTLSDKIHESLFKASGRDFVYKIYEVKNLDKQIKNLRDYNGFNITSPYKTEIIKYLDDIDEVARRCNSVNTVLNKNKKLIGYNTDIIGFENSLKFHNIDIFKKNYKVCIIGFGGVARTILYYFLNNNINNINIFIRNISEQKINLIKNYNKNILVEDINKIKNYNLDYDLLINATPVGAFPDIKNSILTSEVLKKY